MRFTIAAAALVGAASASYGYGYDAPANTTSAAPSDVYTTKTVTELTTYCPYPTTIEQGGSTYTVTEATTLTITHCEKGCTIVEPAPPTEYPSATPPAETSEYAAPPPAPTPEAPYPTGGNATAPVYPSGTAPPTTPSGPAEFPGAASSLQVGGLLAGAGAIAALFL